MEEVVKNDILHILDKVGALIDQKNSGEIKNLSGQTVHNASIFQDEDSINIAVIIYALSKLIERPNVPQELYNNIKNLLNTAHNFLEKVDFHNYNITIEKIGSLISSFDDQLKLYIDKIMNDAQIKKGSKIHQHGISIARTAHMLGVGQWELMSYVGKTKIHDKFETRANTKKRLELARSLFN